MKIFYDLGTHLFEGLREFDKIFHFDRSWKIHAFEANPYTFKKASQMLVTDEWLSSLDISLHHGAVSDQEGTTQFECYYDIEKGDYVDVGSTTNTLRHDYFKDIHKDMYSDMGDEYCHVEQIPTVCFSEFIDKNTNYGDEVYIKMDIEGSEFVTLTKMIHNNTHTLAKVMFIEWHERFWPAEQDKYVSWKNQILNKLAQDKVDARIWW
jgi:FkbM family methyltransferase